MPNSTARLFLIGDIVDHTSFQLDFELGTLAESGAEKLVVWISSHGGDVDPGVHIHSRLRECGLPVTTVNLGEVSSIAVPIFSAGHERLAMPLSYFYLHDLLNEISGGCELDAGSAAYILESVIKRNRWIAEPTADAMRKEIDHVCELMIQNTHLVSEEAVGEGLANEVFEGALIDQVQSLAGAWIRSFSFGSTVAFSEAQLDAATSEETLWVKFEDGLTYFAVAQLVDLVMRAMAQGITKYALYLPASSNNSFHAALCAYNVLASMPIEVQIFANGPVDITSVIFLQAGTSRCVSSGTAVNLRWFTKRFPSHGWLQERDLRRITRDLAIKNNVLTILLSRSERCEEEKLCQACSQGDVVSTEQALEYEWITETFTSLPESFGARAITLVAKPPELPRTIRRILM